MTISNADFDGIRNLVEQEAAIVLGCEKAYLVEAKMDMLARTLGLPPSALLEQIRSSSDPVLRQHVVEALTTNETSFFRDDHPFEALRRHVLPALVEARRPSRRLYIWSAACSTGQEPYSLAIMLREHFPELRDWHVKLLATDIDRTVLERARAARYSEVELRRGMPGQLARRYFRQEGDDWVLDPSIRSMVEFRQLNLKQSWPTLPYMDLVLLRNVLIYFSNETKRAILGRVRETLRPDGYLFMGSSETTHFLDESYRSEQCGSSICYRPPEQVVRAA